MKLADVTGKGVLGRAYAWRVVWLGVAVVFFQLWILWPIHRVVDYPAYDEAIYGATGLRWAAGLGNLGGYQYSPAYVASYGLWSGMGDLAKAIWLQMYVVKAGLAIMLFASLGRVWGSWGAAALVSFSWGCSNWNMEWPIFVAHGALALFLAAVLCFKKHPWTSVGMLVLTALVRLEFALLVPVWLVAVAWRWRADGEFQRARPFDVGVGAALLVLAAWLFSQCSFVTSSERSWFAFQQHYACRASITGQAPELKNPWLDYPYLIKKDFPGAKSLAEAFTKNPKAVLGHVSYSLWHVPDVLAGTVRAKGKLRGGVLVAVVAAAGVLLARPARGERGLLRGLACAGVAVVPGLLILASPAYLVAVVPWCVAAVGAGLAWAGRPRLWLYWGSIVAGVGATVWLVFYPKCFVEGTRPRNFAQTVAVLKTIAADRANHTLMGVGSCTYAYYADYRRWSFVEPLASVAGGPLGHEGVAELVDRVKPDLVLVSREWKNTLAFDATEMGRVLRPPQWECRDVPVGELYCLRR